MSAFDLARLVHILSASILFGSGLAINGLLLAQIGWYGVVVEGRPLVDVLTADFASGSKVHAASKETDDESEETEPMRGARKNSEDA